MSTTGDEQTTAPPAAANSRASVSGAGWDCPLSGELRDLRPRKPFSWLDPRPLIASRNDKIARAKLFGGDPTNDERRRWMAALGLSDPRIDRTDLGERVSFVLAGDTGEGDMSQYVTIPLLDRLSEQTDFMVIVSDVIYPAGGAAMYVQNFYDVYDGYRRPIYAVPGNHDWYDGLSGFMFHLCGAETAPPAPKARLLSRAGLRELLSHRPPRLSASQRADLRGRRDARPAAGQPAPYWLLDTGPLQLVGIDTGITGGIDRDQAAWLRRVSAASPKPKILVTGKPLYVDGRHHAGAIEGEPASSIDDVVRDPAHNYVAAIGGDIHNYQRYPVDVGGGRTIQYLVSGGGGAFMHATHTIPKLALDGVSEHDYRCYPLRGDSLSFYSRLYERKWPFVRDVEIDPVQAAAYMAERLGITATKPDARGVTVTDRTRRAAEQIFPLPGQNKRGLLQSLFSEYFDWNDPPLFKHVLHVEASSAELHIRCLAATGCAGREAGVLEDHLVAAPDADGTWRWTVVAP
ncbi:MAG TPA: hypothetical protein VGO48_09885 [Conexibacter sp.]|nr:hypothetical protein [Conexibacter sp.]